jgi:hypothetical protein
LNWGSSTGVTNTATGYTGSATVTCDAGGYSYSGTSCSAACGGTSVGGYCWYYGASGASCDTVCTGHGGYNSATLNYAGSAGTNAQCNSVLTALGAPGSSTIDAGNCGTWNKYMGCQYVGGRYRCTNATTNSSQGISGTIRACACNN